MFIIEYLLIISNRKQIQAPVNKCIAYEFLKADKQAITAERDQCNKDHNAITHLNQVWAVKARFLESVTTKRGPERRVRQAKMDKEGRVISGIRNSICQTPPALS